MDLNDVMQTHYLTEANHSIISNELLGVTQVLLNIFDYTCHPSHGPHIYITSLPQYLEEK